MTKLITQPDNDEPISKVESDQIKNMTCVCSQTKE